MMKRFTLKIPVLLTLSIILVIIHPNYASPPNLAFKHLRVEDGLSQSWIRVIYQDSYGFMWFGTNDGLNKYDGYTFTVYKHIPGNKKSISSNTISSIFEDADKNLWIGTLTGLNRYDRMHDQFVRKEGWPKRNVYTFLAGDQGAFYLSSFQGLYVYDPQKDSFDIFSHAGLDTNNLNNNHITDFLTDKHGNFWIGTIDGLNLLDARHNQVFYFKHEENNKHSINANFIRTLYLDSKGRVWFGTNNNGLNLVKYNINEPQNTHFVKYLPGSQKKSRKTDSAILSLQEDSRGFLWIGTSSDGIYILDLNRLQEDPPVFYHHEYNFSNLSSISNSPIQPIFEDQNKNIWLGTFNDGLNIYNQLTNQFEHYKYEPYNNNCLSNNSVKVFYEQDNHVWIGTSSGLNLFDKTHKTFKHFFYDPNDDKSPGANNISAIICDSENNLWIGTAGGGLNRFNPKDSTFIRFLTDAKGNSLGMDDISSILQDKQGRMWISTTGGGLCLFDYKTKMLKRYTHDSDNKSTLSNNWLRTLFETSYGELWISTDSAIELFDESKGKFIHFSRDNSDETGLNYSRARVFFEDSRKNLWVGSQGGLNVYNRQDSTFTCYFEEDGLPNNQIKGILEDAHGNLWIASNKGISNFIRGIERPEILDFKNYDVGDGLQGSEFIEKACLKTKDGYMYFGGSNGFNIFHPDSLRTNPSVPKVVITNFLISNKSVRVGEPDSPLKCHINFAKEITLSYKHSVVTFEYAALNYINPEKNQYAYMLEGFDADWNYVGNKHSATYTNLDPGEYIFKVKGSNNDGVWNNEGASVRIKILPPWWKSGLAYIIYFIIVGIMIYFIGHFQLNRIKMRNQLAVEQQHAEKLEQINRMKTRFFSNITHEFRTPLALIMGPIKKIIAQDKNNQFEQDSQTILKNSQKLYRLINQLLDLSKLDAGSMQLKACKENIVPFLAEVVMLFLPLAEQKKIRINFDVQCDSDRKNQIIEVYIDRDKFEKIVSNLLSNAIKFTPAGGQIDVHLTQHKNHIEIIFQDTGIGISPEELDKIFDRFYQVDESHTRKYEGTGIGLALIKELVELHHGSISVISQINKGSQFMIQLPLGKAHLKQDEIVSETSESEITDMELLAYHEFDTIDIPVIKSDKNKKNNAPLILIIEDNSDLRKYLRASLENTYQIIEAVNGEKGIEKANSTIPDLIISDVMMPGIDGFELCKRVKTNEQTSHIPVILLTARAAFESKIEGLETGADDYITKPFEIRELEVRIRNLIELRRQVQKHFKKLSGLKPEEIATTSRDEEFLKKTLTILEQNISDSEFNVSQFSRAIAISSSHLNRKMKALTGQSTQQFILTFRLNRAAQLLRDDSGTVLEIANSVGIESISHFSKSFQKQFGVSPSRYRK